MPPNGSRIFQMPPNGFWISKTPAAGHRRTHKQFPQAICGYCVSIFTFLALMLAPKASSPSQGSAGRVQGENNCNDFCRELYLLGKTNAATNAEVHKKSLWTRHVSFSLGAFTRSRNNKKALDNANQIMPIIGQKPLQFIVFCCFSWFWRVRGPPGGSFEEVTQQNIQNSFHPVRFRKLFWFMFCSTSDS